MANRTSVVNPIKIKPNSQVEDLLESSLCWDFDIFKLEEITGQRPLYYLGLDMVRKFDMCATFNIDEDTFKRWLVIIEDNYHQQNSYHNSSHAADVMQVSVFALLLGLLCLSVVIGLSNSNLRLFYVYRYITITAGS